MNIDLLDNFFSKVYENKINKQLLYYDFAFPKESVINYIDEIINTPIKDYIEYIYLNKKTDAIEAKDVFQFSSFEDATVNIINKLKTVDNPGVSFIEAGKMLQADGVSRKPGADTKYGENHLKTGDNLGLLFELTKIYFVSCIGIVFSELNETQQEHLMTRLILRTRLVTGLIKATRNGNVNVRQFLYMLSESTYNRRKSNIKKVLEVLEKSSEYDFGSILSKLYFNSFDNTENNISNIIQYDIYDYELHNDKLQVATPYVPYDVNNKRR